MCRLAFPICFNFIQTLKIEKKDTSLEEVMGVMDLFPVFGTYFTLFYPMILLLLCFMNLFNFIEKITKFIGFSTFSLKNFDGKENIEDGLNEFNRSK
jgi:xanthine/uracil permease